MSEYTEKYYYESLEFEEDEHFYEEAVTVQAEPLPFLYRDMFISSDDKTLKHLILHVRNLYIKIQELEEQAANLQMQLKDD